MSRRHASLIPLSRQHQHALALSLIIRRRFGIGKGEATWQEEIAARIGKLYTAELSAHFEVEEAVLFPDMERYLGPLELLSELRPEHQSLRHLVQVIGSRQPVFLPTADEFAALLEQHIRKEERQLFPEFEKRMPAEEALKVGREIDARLIKACSRL